MFAVNSQLLEPLVVGPAWWQLALISAAGLGATWLIGLVERLRFFAAVRRWIPLLLVVIWAMVAAAWLRRLVVVDDPFGVARLATVIVLVLVALPWLRDVFESIVFVIESRYRIGDDLRVATVEGRLVTIGVRGIVLRTANGTECVVPHAELARAQVVRLDLENRDAPCELVLPAPAGVDLDLSVDQARSAAALSPYAAPRFAPQVLLAAGTPGEGPCLRLRGFAFDREHEHLYRSDVHARFLRMTRATRGLGNAARADTDLGTNIVHGAT
jgi:hypothetical protein